MSDASIRSIEIPRYIFVEPKAISKLFKIIKNEFKKPMILSQSNLSMFFSKYLTSIDHHFFEVKTVPVMKDLMNNSLDVLSHNVDVVVGIGGGTVLDSAKFLAHILHLPLILAPTLVSNDGICSPISSLVIGEKRRKSIKSKMPYAVFVDTDIISAAPVKYLLAGIGDIISKLNALEDWVLSNRITGEKIDYFAWTIAKSSVLSVINFKNPNLEDISFLETVIEALIMSGISIALADSSRPASGSEHSLSHAADIILNFSGIHGLQTGFYTCVSLKARNNIHYNDVLIFLKTINFFKRLPGDLFDVEIFKDIARLAPKIRNRYTILNEISIPSLVFAFKSVLSDIKDIVNVKKENSKVKR